MVLEDPRVREDSKELSRTFKQIGGILKAFEGATEGKRAQLDKQHEGLMAKVAKILSRGFVADRDSQFRELREIHKLYGFDWDGGEGG